MIAGLKTALPVFKAAMARWDAGTGYLNFEENAVDSRQFYDDITHRRLARVKAQVDPREMFRVKPPDQAGDWRSRSHSLSFSAAPAALSPAPATPAPASLNSCRKRSA